MASYDAPTGSPSGFGGGRKSGAGVGAAFTVDSSSLDKLHTTWQKLIGDVHGFNAALKGLDSGIRTVERLATATDKLRRAQPSAGSVGNYGIPQSGINKGPGAGGRASVFGADGKLANTSGGSGGVGGSGGSGGGGYGGARMPTKTAMATGALIGIGGVFKDRMPDILSAQRFALEQSRSTFGSASANSFIKGSMYSSNSGGYASTSERQGMLNTLGNTFGPGSLGTGYGQSALRSSSQFGELMGSGQAGANAQAQFAGPKLTVGLMGIGINTYSARGQQKPIDQLSREILTRIYGGKMPAIENLQAGMREGGRLRYSLTALGLDPDTQDAVIQYGLAQAKSTAAGQGQIDLTLNGKGQIAGTAANKAAGIAGSASLTDSARRRGRAGAELTQNLGAGASGELTTYNNVLADVYDKGSSALKVKVIGDLVGAAGIGGMALGGAKDVLGIFGLTRVLKSLGGGAGGGGGGAGGGGGGAASGVLGKVGRAGLGVGASLVAGNAVSNLGRNPTTGHKNTIARIAGGAVSGAGSGASIGSVVPGIGTVIGGAVGAGAGIAASGFNDAFGKGSSFWGFGGGDSSSKNTTRTAPGSASGLRDRGGAPAKSRVVWPANGPITQSFGHNGHPGTDIGAPCNAPIVATEDGTVIDAGPASGFGNWIVISHPDGYTTVYGHMYNDGVLVRSGARVTAGQQIGKVGSNGMSTGCHLHFEVHVGWPGQRIDPVPWLRSHNAAQGAAGAAGASSGTDKAATAGAAAGAAPASLGGISNYGSREELDVLGSVLSGGGGGAGKATPVARQGSQPGGAGAAPAGTSSAVPSGSPQGIAKAMLNARGWGSQWGAFNALEMMEAGWNVHATNPSSGAYGLPQALPASKMASAGADWHDNPATQLKWMMGYISGRYGDPNGALAHEKSAHWYATGGTVSPRFGGTLARVGEAGRAETITDTATLRGGFDRLEGLITSGKSAGVRSYLGNAAVQSGSSASSVGTGNTSHTFQAPLVSIGSITLPLTSVKSISQDEAQRLVRMVSNELESNRAIQHLALGTVRA